MYFVECTIEVVKCHLNGCSFINDKWIVCESLCLFYNCFHEICVNFMLKIFVTVIPYE